jgi:4-amino-4-deoxy-L-arabinose transferase-like glycosyltransferase
MTASSVKDKERSGGNRLSAYESAFAILIALVIVLIISISLNKRFDHDEFEHIHSSWYILKGAVPYSDFYQHHHPLLWIVMAPLIALLGESAQTAVHLRFMMLAQLVMIIIVVYKLVRIHGRSREAGLWAALLLSTMVMFIEKAVEIRPDVPQVLCGLVSVLYLLRYLERRGRRDLLIAALMSAVAFLFLQKHLFLLALIGLALLWQAARRKIPFSDIFVFAGGFLALQLLFLAGLLLTGNLEDYFITNWKLNLSQADFFSGFGNFTRSLRQNPLFWALGFGGALYLSIRRKASFAVRFLALAGIVLVLAAFIAKIPHRQYYMASLPFLAAAGGIVAAEIMDRLRLRPFIRIVLLLVFILVPSIALTQVNGRANSRQLRLVDYVLSVTTANDRVYDGDIQFNLFRPDLHYFWYSVAPGKGLDAYNRVTHGRYADYDLCELIYLREPKIVYQFNFQIADCNLLKYYKSTPYRRIYLRRESPGHN